MSSGRIITLNTGHKMASLGFGTMGPSPEEAVDVIVEALKVGYRHFDFAKIYRNQKGYGVGLKRAFAEIPGLKREDIFVTSKLWNNKHAPKDVEAALDDTLEELGLDYLDLYIIHWPVAFAPGEELSPTIPGSNPPENPLSNDISITDTWRAMTKLPETKVRSVGVSNFTPEQIDVIVRETGVVPAVNQVERHPRLPQPELIDYCHKKGIAIVAYSSFGNNGFRMPLLLTHPDIIAVTERLSAIRRRRITPAQVILAWTQLPGVAVIPKSEKRDRMIDNFDEIELDEEALQAIDKLASDRRRFNVPCLSLHGRWNVNVFNEDCEKDTTGKVILI